MLDSPGCVNRMLDSPRVTRELRLTLSRRELMEQEEDSAKGTGPPLHVRTGRRAKCVHWWTSRPCGREAVTFRRRDATQRPARKKEKSHTDVTGDSCVTDCTTPCADTCTLAHATARLDPFLSLPSLFFFFSPVPFFSLSLSFFSLPFLFFSPFFFFSLPFLFSPSFFFSPSLFLSMSGRSRSWINCKNDRGAPTATSGDAAGTVTITIFQSYCADARTDTKHSLDPAPSSKDLTTTGSLYAIVGIDVVTALVPEEDVWQLEETKTCAREIQFQDGEL